LEAEVLDTAAGVEVRLRGQAGVLEADALDAVLRPLAARRPAWVVFELSKLESLSSLAMGVLVAYRRAAVRAGARVGLAADLQPGVREALDRAGVRSLFEDVGPAKPGVAPGATDDREPHPNGDDAPGSVCLTWAQLFDLEPRLETLLWRAREAGAACRTVTDVDRVFGPVRNELTALIGFAGTHHRHAVLGSPRAYQVAHAKLYDAVAGLLPGRAARAEAVLETQPAPGNYLARRAG
jgi:anti-anti-sigma factor